MNARQLNDSNSVPVGPLRDRLLELRRQGVSDASIARRLGWTVKREMPENDRVTRTLGLTLNARGGRQKQITPEVAERLAKALEM